MGFDPIQLVPLAGTHVGSLVWRYHHVSGFNPNQHGRVWHGPSQPIAYAWYFPSYHGADVRFSHTLSSDERKRLETDALRWLGRFNSDPGDPLKIGSTAAEADWLLKRGFKPDRFHVKRFRRLTELAYPPIPAWPIRQANTAHLQRVVTLHNICFDSKVVSLGSYHALQGSPAYRPSLDLVAFNDQNEPIGFALGWIDPIQATALLEPIGVHPDWRRRGVSRALIDRLCHDLHQIGIPSLDVETESDNAAAIALYQRLQFEEIGREYDYVK